MNIDISMFINMNNRNNTNTVNNNNNTIYNNNNNIDITNNINNNIQIKIIFVMRICNNNNSN